MNEWTTIPTDEVINKTAESLNANNMKTFIVDNKEQALKKLLELIPEGKDVNTGSSTSLKQIGFMDLLKSDTSKYNYVGKQVVAEDDAQKRADLRRKSIAVEYFVSSVNALTEKGQLIAVDATGSRIGTLPFAAEKVVIVVSANKIVKDLDTAFKRIKEYVFPLEDKRMKSEYGEQAGSSLNKWLIMEKEFMPDRTTVIIVKESLGF